MQPAKGFRSPGDIGGPMNLGEEYRWNAPLLTYGFDQSFLDYFGSNGVAAVEQAFQVLNDLPAASSIDLADYSLNVHLTNPVAENQNLLDLKTQTLKVVLEQLGLTQPVRSIFVLRQYDPIFETNPNEENWPAGVIPTNILERNFDPETLLPSHSVNDVLFGGVVFRHPISGDADVAEFVIDPTESPNSAVADMDFTYFGEVVENLSADDAGGLRYLLRTNNVNYETLLPDVHGMTNEIFVNAALRPGVDKITFARQQFDSLIQQWIPVTNQFVDPYLTNGEPAQQTVERVIAQPDFRFSAGDTGLGQSYSPTISRTGTTHWQNNGSSGALGPGVIRPPIQFTFNKLQTTVSTSDYLGVIVLHDLPSAKWASFDETTNPPTIYPVVTFQETNSFTIRFRMSPETFEWHPNIPFGGTVLLQTSTNLTSWETITTVTNKGGVVEWRHQRESSTQLKRFFRAIPE
jgi:hypothetical protein